MGGEVALLGSTGREATQRAGAEPAAIGYALKPGARFGAEEQRRVRGLLGRAFVLPRAALEPLPRPAFGAARPDGDSGAAGQTLTHAVMAPVREPRAVSGAIVAAFTSPPSDPERTVWATDAYAGLFALALASPAALQGLLQSEAIDGLTGCRTYQSVLRRLEREINRSSRSGDSLACCFIDLDGFNRINDQYGHPYGNHVLGEIGTILVGGVRSFDTVGRYGGDEFITIFPQTDEHEAEALALRLHSLITNATSRSLQLPITASIGVAAWTPGMSAEQLLESADQALYEAKRRGEPVITSSQR